MLGTVLVTWSCCCLVTKSCPNLCDPIDCSLPCSSVHRTLQARILGFPFPSPGDLPDPGIKPASSAFEADSLPLSHQESSIIRVPAFNF